MWLEIKSYSIHVGQTRLKRCGSQNNLLINLYLLSLYGYNRQKKKKNYPYLVGNSTLKHTCKKKKDLSLLLISEQTLCFIFLFPTLHMQCNVILAWAYIFRFNKTKWKMLTEKRLAHIDSNTKDLIVLSNKK